MWTYIHIHTHKYPHIPKHIYIYPYIPWLKTTQLKWEVNSVNHRLDIECIPSQLGSNESEMEYQLFRHNNGCPHPWLIQFGIMSLPILAQFLLLNTNKSFQTVCIWSLFSPGVYKDHDSVSWRRMRFNLNCKLTHQLSRRSKACSSVGSGTSSSKMIP